MGERNIADEMTRKIEPVEPIEPINQTPAPVNDAFAERVERHAARILTGMHAASYVSYDSNPNRMRDLAKDALMQAKFLVEQADDMFQTERDHAHALKGTLDRVRSITDELNHIFKGSTKQLNRDKAKRQRQELIEQAIFGEETQIGARETQTRVRRGDRAAIRSVG